MTFINKVAKVFFGFRNLIWRELGDHIVKIIKMHTGKVELKYLTKITVS